MAERFIGSKVILTLAKPPGAKVRGLITNVVDRRLTLKKVTWIPSGDQREWAVVSGADITDLDIEPETTPPTASAATPTLGSRNALAADPAIVSYARPPIPDQVQFVSPISAQTATRPLEAFRSSVSPIRSTPQTTSSSGSRKKDLSEEIDLSSCRNGKNGARGRPNQSAVLTEPFSDLSLNGHLEDRGNENASQQPQIDSKDNVNKANIQAHPGTTPRKGKSKRGRQKNGVNKEKENIAQLQTSAIAEDGENLELQSTPKMAMGPGWRETPLTETRETSKARRAQLKSRPEPIPSIGNLLPPGSRSGRNEKRSRKQRQNDFNDQNGWATGEASDIQDMGDFDFEENHKKFDKKKVFEQIRQEDTTADEARLVSFNRLPARPGTYGGKNLHYTENVLDSPIKDVIDHSSNSELGVNEAKISSGRSSRRASSRTTIRKVQSRKGSALAAADGQPVGSGILPHIKDGQGRRILPVGHKSSSLNRKSSARQRSYVLRTTTSQKPCPSVSPLQMVELEQLAISELDMTEEMMAENAATAIAMTARKMAVQNQENAMGPPDRYPIIVVLAGNHRTGSRAIAAARQLRNHHAQVLLCVLGLDRESDLLDSVRRQLNIYRKRGGEAIAESDLAKTLRQSHPAAGRKSRRRLLDADLIVDAILGIHSSYEDLAAEDQAGYARIVGWANGSDALTISIDIPSGVDSSTGEPSRPSQLLQTDPNPGPRILKEDPSLVVAADHVLSLGAPKNGLVLGREKVESFEHHSSWLVADIGLDSTVWKRSGLRGGKGVDFGSEWVTSLELVPDSEK